MTPHSKAALQIQLNEYIKKRDDLKEMAYQYEVRATQIKTEEIPELDEKIRGIQADLE